MFKFKMSLLLNNVKFRVAIILLLITAITTGIIFIPKNKADNLSQEVNIKACDTGMTVGGRNLYSLSKDGNATGYDNVFCIKEEANVGKSGYRTYSKPMDILTGNSFFTNINCGMWFVNNMYLSNIKGEGVSNEIAKEVSLINLANLLTSDTVKQSVKQKTGADFSDVTPQKIYNLKEKKIGVKEQRNAIEVIEQIAIWNFTKNTGTTVSSAYSKNPTEYIKNANLSQDEQKTLKYIYYAFIDVTNRNANKASSPTTSNQVLLNSNNAKYYAEKKLVGPYYIESNGIRLTSYTFGEVANASYPIQVTITKADNTTVKAGKEVVVKNSDGSFYINLATFKDVKNVKFVINHILSGVNTKAYVLAAGGKEQDILTVQKSLKATSLYGEKNIEILPGKYSVELYKVNEKGEVIRTPAKFKINDNVIDTNAGVIKVATDVEVKDDKTVATYTIKEVNAPENYYLYDGEITLRVKMTKVNEAYVLTKEGITLEKSKENVGVKFTLEGSTIKVYVPNIQKYFDLALRKYISKINGEKVEPSREPVINEKSILMLEKTGTASYYHAKNSISVRVGDEIEYTIRVYNEGEILSFAKQITDYLPKGLSFVKLSDDNSKEFTTTSEVGSKVVVINYNGNTLIKTLRDFIGKEVKVNNEYYQEVKMICKVENTDKVYITNRAEITNYGYNEKDENGQVIWKEAKALNNVDKDSIQNTIKNALKLDTWYENAKENTYVDENGKTVVDKNYYPGVQDDDDFETVELLTGKYSIVIRKIDSTDSKKVLQGAQFTVKGSNIENEKILKPTDVNGHTMVVSGVAIQNEKQVDTYTIKETKAPQGYKLFDGEINVKVATKFDGTNFVIDNEKTTVNGENITYSVNSDNTIIGIVVTNEKKDFDLALRKFITKVNGKELAESREPVINEKSILMLEKTGTASYYHAKNSISVIAGDEIEYTLRVYNEGNILGFAKQITDYLPEGLSFVKLSDENSKEFTTTSEVGSNKVVINYSGNTLIKTLRDFIGKEVKVTNEYYQEVKLICKVENVDKLYITNRAEITNYGYNEKDENEKVIWKEAKEINDVDKDSVQDTIKSELNLDTWYEKVEENTYVDENGKTVVDTNYYPGVEDDDDFETVVLLTGKYSIVINKVDATDSKKVLQGAQFTVKGSNIENETTLKPTNEKGNTVVVSGVVIQNEKQVDSYTIKETQAPKDYKLLDGEIKVKVATKFNGTSFVIDSKNTTVDGKNIKFSVDENNTTISIVVANEKKSFDLALRKFITEVNGKELAENRAPQVDVSKLVNGTAKTATYNHSKVPVDVNTTDIVTYTIRVYNEGELDGYASKIMDDVPEGLVFVPATFDENGKPTNINAKYGWTLYREVKSGEKVDSLNSIKYNGKTYVVTDKVEEAEVIVTDYLSKENGENNLMKAFDSTTMKQLDYKDVKVAFKVIEPTTSDRVIVNYAQITEHTDSDGNPTIVDRDSTPNEWKDKEDDQDIEKIKVRYFDLSLLKWVTKAIVYENGVETVTETGHTGYENPEPIVKVDLKDTSINDVVVKFEYTIRITNDGDKGQIAGYAKEISDYIPEGLKFDPADNPEWKEVDGKIVTRALENTLLKPGEFADVTVILTWINGQDNLGLKTNIAEISEDYNEFGTPDIDSVPNNKVPDEDDIDDAPVMLSIRTGRPIVYTGLAVGVLSIISLGAVVIRKRVL